MFHFYFFLLLCLTIHSRSFFPKCMYACTCMHAHTPAPPYIFLPFDYLDIQYTWLFLGDDLINHLNHSWYFWAFEMLAARKPSHFWKKGCHKYWTLLEKEPDANGKYKYYPRKVLHLYIQNFLYLVATCRLYFFSSCRCPFPRKYDWNIRNVKLINTLYSSFGSCRFSNGFICI